MSVADRLCSPPFASWLSGSWGIEFSKWRGLASLHKAFSWRRTKQRYGGRTGMPQAPHGGNNYLTPPPLKSPPPCNPPPPRGGRPSLHCFARQYLLWWFVFPICHTHISCIAFPLVQSVTCVYSVIFSLQRRCTGCRIPFSDPRCFLPVTMYGTSHAHLVHMCWPLL